MARLRFKNSRPPKGFVYLQAETNLRIEGEDYGAIMKKVLDHRQYRSLPRATLFEVQEDVERQICASLTVAECKAEGPGDELRPREESLYFSIGKVMSFSKAALEWMSTGRELVSVDESKRRAAICKQCPLMAPLSGCGCNPIHKMIALAVPAERRDQELGICRACGCELKSKVNLPENVIRESNSGRDIKWPAMCWQKEISGKQTE
jgi:hypothetical protein